MANNNPFINGTPAPVPAPSAGPMMPTSAGSPDSFEVDLTNIQSQFTVPDGAYRAKCVEVEQSVSKGGNPMFVWTFEIVEGPHTGFQTKVFTAITPAAIWKVAETVQALGVGQSGSVCKFRRSDVINKECGILMEQGEYNGQTRSSVTRTMSLQELAEVRNAN